MKCKFHICLPSIDACQCYVMVMTPKHFYVNLFVGRKVNLPGLAVTVLDTFHDYWICFFFILDSMMLARNQVHCAPVCIIFSIWYLLSIFYIIFQMEWRIYIWLLVWLLYDSWASILGYIWNGTIWTFFVLISLQLVFFFFW